MESILTGTRFMVERIMPRHLQTNTAPSAYTGQPAC
jgi:hypothetical protein